MVFISRPRITPNKIESRAYQETMADACLKGGNTLLILPTGLGKTIIALMVVANILEKGKKVFIFAPTKPLVEQHYKSFSTLLTDTKIGTMTGYTPPKKRKDVVDGNDVIICTPQVVSNDLDSCKYDLVDFGLIIYDEAHRAVGNYAYVNIARYYKNGLVLGMTASPGSNKNKIKEVCSNLGIKRIDTRSDNDSDVLPYIHDVSTNRIEVSMPECFTEIVLLLNEIMDRYISRLKGLDLISSSRPISTKYMLAVGENLQKKLINKENVALTFEGLIYQAVCIKILYAIGLVETQGIAVLKQYIQKLIKESRQKKKSRASKEIVATEEFKKIRKIVETTRVEHPKISKIMGLISQELNKSPKTKIMIFSQYRDTCDMIAEKVSKIPNVHVAKLVGQSNDGLKQKEQIDILDKFREGIYNTIVSTSVGEEGLDIANIDMVIFYEPVPSEIRTIQRRGRTGRKDTGKVYVLVTKDTRDEVFEETSQKKEIMMREGLNDLFSEELPCFSKSQTKIDRF
ncbi:MAG: DEAD/DEAH box helicase family protein [archaeon]|nr:DEAD/DEAH box helicase family protein [archaeon]